MNRGWVASFILSHIVWIVAGGVGLVSFRAWKDEHDAHLSAQMYMAQYGQQLKDSQQRVESLQQQIQDTQEQAQEERAQLLAAAARVRTPQQAIAAMPDVSMLPVLSRPTPSSVEVAAVPLYQQEVACKVDHQDLLACQSETGKKDQILAEKDSQIADKDKEIKLLKHPKGFFARVKEKVSDLTLGAVAGEVLRVVLTGRP